MLAGAVESVLDQDYEDFELIVSDNASTDATPDILERYASDARLHTIRQEQMLDVTANWSAALAASSGGRVLLIGDDDLLLPGYFERADALLAEHDNPDVLVHNAYTYAFPGTGGRSVSHFLKSSFVANEPPAWGEVEASERRQAARRYFEFDFCLPLNMQVSLVTRQALARFPEGLYKRPFPDNYASIGLLLTAAHWAVSPERLVVIGISPKSYGSSAMTSAEKDMASRYLGVDPSFAGLLPGSVFFSGHYQALQELKRDFSTELSDTEIDRGAYVLFQMYVWYRQLKARELDARELWRRIRLLGWHDWVALPRAVLKRLRLTNLRHLLGSDSGSAHTALSVSMQPLPQVSNIVEFSQWLQTTPAWR